MRRRQEPIDAHAWMQLQLRTLFVVNAAGRLVCVNDSAGTPAPRVFLGRTLAGNVWSVRADLPHAIADVLGAELVNEPVPDRLDGRGPYCEARLRALLAQVSPRPVLYRGPAFRFAGQPAPVPNVVDATQALLSRFAPMRDLRIEDVRPAVARLVEGNPVSVCVSVRRGEHACEAGLETLEHARGHGYGTESVRGWARAVFESGREPLYSTWWQNVASLGVARRLQLVPLGEDWHLT